jgi:hypothetical protein
MIENVERFCAELQAQALSEPEILEDRSVHGPVTRPDKSVAGPIARAAQTGCSKKSLGKVEAIRPLGAGCIHMVCDGIRTVI